MVLLVVGTQRLITNEELYEFDMFVSNVEERSANLAKMEHFFLCF